MAETETETEVKPKWVFSFDPGEKNIGWAMFQYHPDRKIADLRAMRIVHIDNFMGILDTLDALAKKLDSTFVVENFRVDTIARQRTSSRSRPTFQWSEMETIRVIGMIQYLAHRTDSQIVLQEPRILNMARKWCDLPLPKGHIPDDKSAYIHGAHFMMKERWITGVEEISKYGQETIA